MVLKIKDVGKLAIELFSPKMGASGSLDELRCYSQSVASLAHTAFKNVTDAKLTPDDPNIHRFSFVSEAGIARYDEEPADT